MKTKILKSIIAIISIILVMLISCDKKLTEPEYNNPFDPQNPQTGGDPFKLESKIANGGITLEWDKPDFPNLQSYKIYRSETENNGYSVIQPVGKTITTYTDTLIKNGHSYWYRVTALDNKGKETKVSNTAAVNIKTKPVLVINGGDEYTSSKAVDLTILANTAQDMTLSNISDFSGANWESYTTSKSWTLLTGEGQKTIYLKIKYDNEKESEIIQTTITPKTVSAFTVSINNSDTTNILDVTLNIHAEDATKMLISNDSVFSESVWEDYNETKNWRLDYSKAVNFTAKVFIKFKNNFEIETVAIYDDIYLEIISGVKINNDDEYTSSRLVTLNIFSENANEMMLSDKENFSGESWETYSETKDWTLPTGTGPFTVYAKFKNSSGLISNVYSDNILPQPIDPSIMVSNGDQYTTTRDIQLSISASGSNLQMKLSEDSTFSGINWQSYTETPSYQLSTGDGTKTVYTKIKNDFEIESSSVNDDIIMDTTPPTIALTISPDSGITNETNFQFDPTASNDNLAPAADIQVRFDYDNNGSFDTGWEQLSVISYQYSVGGGDKMVKMQLKDGAGWQADTMVNIFVNSRPQAAFSATRNDNNYKLYYFDASTSTDYEDGTNLGYRWDFDGDGSWDTGYLTQDTISYKYSDYGDYSPILVVRDQNNLTAEDSEQLNVQQPLDKMIFVKGDVFTMGDTWGDGDSNEKPTHQVTLSSFYIGKYEITNQQVVEVYNWALAQGKITVSSSTVQNSEGNIQELLDLDYSGCQISYFGSQLVVDNGKENYPALAITWYGSAALCNYLSEKESLNSCYNLSDWSCDFTQKAYRLPTEAEWEYSARGGNSSQGYKYSGSDSPEDVAWYSSNSGSQTHEVGTKQANELGIYDMSGNICEWCWDWYSSYTSDSQSDPKGPSSGSYRVLRGGSLSFEAYISRIAKRHYRDPNIAYNDTGFRISRTF